MKQQSFRLVKSLFDDMLDEDEGWETDGNGEVRRGDCANRLRGRSKGKVMLISRCPQVPKEGA